MAMDIYGKILCEYPQRIIYSNPMRKGLIVRCIMCKKEKLSDKHVFPDAIGGTLVL